MWRNHFSSFVPILDFIHALSYVFASATAGRSFENIWSLCVVGRFDFDVDQINDELFDRTSRADVETAVLQMHLGDQVQVFSTSLREIKERFLLQEFSLRPIESINPSRKEELNKLEQAGFEQLFESTGCMTTKCVAHRDGWGLPSGRTICRA